MPKKGPEIDYPSATPPEIRRMIDPPKKHRFARGGGRPPTLVDRKIIDELSDDGLQKALRRLHGDNYVDDLLARNEQFLEAGRKQVEKIKRGT